MDTLRIFTLSVWGLCTPGKMGDLESFLRDFRVRVGVITEVKELRFPSFPSTLLSRSCAFRHFRDYIGVIST